MRRLITIALLIGCAFLSPFSASAADAPAVRIAILTGDGDRAVSEATLAQLEVALTGVKDITLLERAQIRKILAEQKLSAAGLSDPATAVKLGKLLSVEMFVFVERIPKTQPPICRVQVTETRTGIVLTGGVLEEKAFAGDAPECLEWVRVARAKVAAPPAERHYLGILGIRNEDPGQALDGIARTLCMLLSSDLQQSPNLVLLDREHLQRLRDEKALTAADLALKPSSVLAEGGVRRSPDPGRVELTLLLQPLSGGAAERLSLRFAPEELAEFRGKLAAAIMERMNLKPLEQKRTDPAREGKSFLAQAALLTASGDPDAGLMAAEAAYALWPSSATRQELVLSCRDRVLDETHRTSGTTTSHTSDEFAKASEAEQCRSLRFQQRMLALLIEEYRLEFAPAEKARRARPVPTWLGVSAYPGSGIVVVEAKGEASALEAEVAAQQRQLFDIVLAAARRDWKEHGTQFWYALDSAMYKLCYASHKHPAEVAKGWTEIFDLWREAPAGSDGVFSGGGFKIELLRGLDGVLWLRYLKDADATDVRRPYLAALRPLTDDPDPWVRCIGNYGRASVDPSATDSVEAVLKFIRDVDWKQCAPGREPGLEHAAMGMIGMLGVGDPGRAASWCEEIMGPWMKEGGPSWLVAKWDNFVPMWARFAEKAGGKTAAGAVYGRVIAAVQDCVKRRPDDFGARWWRVLIQGYEAERLRLGVNHGPAAGQDDPWNQYEIRPLGLKLPASADAALLHNDRLYCFSCRKTKDGERQVTLTVHPFPAGGPAERTETMTVPVQDPLTFDLPWPAFIGDRLYVGTVGGIVLFRNGQPPKLLTEADGLPGNIISTMAAYGGKLYLGIGRGETPKRGFAVFDPDAGTSRIIYSNTSLDAEQHRDMPIRMIIADEQNKCLWIGPANAPVSRYDPEKDALRAVVTSPHDVGFGYTDAPMLLGRGGLLYVTGGAGLFFLDVSTLKQTWLAGATYVGLIEGQQPAFGKPGCPTLWPAWYDGTDLITCSRVPNGSAKPYLYLHRLGREAAVNRNFQALRLFLPTPNGLLAMDSKRDGCLILKKPSVSTLTETKP